MGFFSGMGFWEKVAFTVLSPVILPVAAAAAAYEKVTEGKPFFDSETPNNQDEQEAVERVERQAKEKRAEEERKAIVSYTKNGLIALQKSHSITDELLLSPFNFTQLRKAVQNNQQPIEILTQLVAGVSESDIGSTADQEIMRLNKEVKELEKLRLVILNISEVSA